jgi:hypothetical protein
MIAESTGPVNLRHCRVEPLPVATLMVRLLTALSPLPTRRGPTPTQRLGGAGSGGAPIESAAASPSAGAVKRYSRSPLRIMP